MESHFTGNGGGEHYADGTTGRFLILFAEDAVEQGVAALSDAAGVSVTAAEAGNPVPDEPGNVVYEELGVAVVDAAPAQLGAAVAAAADGSGAILALEPERVVLALEVSPIAPPAPGMGNGRHGEPAPQLPPPAPLPGRSAEYLQGFRDAVLHLTAPLAASVADGVAPPLSAAVDETQATWGVQMVRGVNSCRTGRGVRLAVLDTGMDLAHPDFAGRDIVSASFIPGEAVQDLHGHGTHCIGTAAGPRCPAEPPRYGVAPDAEIYAGKVLNNRGFGTDAQILAGINWAIKQGCAVISMSLGGRVALGQRFSAVFEAVAQRAATAGSLIIAAVGNDSRRPAQTSAVSHPANCPSIMACAAVDAALGIASFSNRGLNPDGGQVDVAAPGVGVLSAVPMPARHGLKSGTSMATPHAAGVAALLAEANPKARGAALGRLLIGSARRLPNLSSADVGAGLVQAP